MFFINFFMRFLNLFIIGIIEFNESYPLFDCLRQSILNTLNEFDFLSLFIKLYNADEENNLTKLSLLRVFIFLLISKKYFP